MYGYEWTNEYGIFRLTIDAKLQKEIRPVFHEELDFFGMDEYWDYPIAKTSTSARTRHRSSRAAPGMVWKTDCRMRWNTLCLTTRYTASKIQHTDFLQEVVQEVAISAM